jgi:hypothetical protein
MSNLSRDELNARYKLFKHFGGDDQRQFYEASVGHHRKAASQVNQLRALLALATGFASALAGLMVEVSMNPKAGCLLGKQEGAVATTFTSYCLSIQTLTNVLLALAVIAPAFAGALNILTDLYQWDRLTSIYSAARENMEVAYADAPDDDMPDDAFRLSIESFGKNTLAVMAEETSQWGQSVRTPQTLDKFLKEESDKAAQANAANVENVAKGPSNESK